MYELVPTEHEIFWKQFEECMAYETGLQTSLPEELDHISDGGIKKEQEATCLILFHNLYAPPVWR